MNAFSARATLRLAAAMAVAVTLLALAGMGLQYRLVQMRLMAASATLLAADLEGFAALYDQRRIIALRQAIQYRADAGAEEIVMLRDRAGAVLAGTRADWPDGMGARGQGFAPDPAGVVVLDGQRWLTAARDVPGGFSLLVGRSLAPMDATLAAMRRGMLGLAVLLLAAGAGVGWLGARWVMRRIGAVNALADRVAAGDLHARLPGDRSADEFGLLETHVHAMLDRIENLNRATHRLSDTIAHELRTPLNRMLLRLADVQGQPEVTDALRAEIRQAIRVFDSLLDISRAEADQGSGGGLVPVDLAGVAAEVWELYQPLAEDKGLVCQAALGPPAMILGDRNLIAQMLANLLDNAIKYCRVGDALTLSLTDAGARHLLRLADTGPGLPEDIKADAFDRFTRADRDRATPGHGLGLALVRAIALRHGAKLETPATEVGFVLEIGWPKGMTDA